jgi:hypothetical protein
MLVKTGTITYIPVLDEVHGNLGTEALALECDRSSFAAMKLAGSDHVWGHALPLLCNSCLPVNYL